jgi:hypothetical protein
VNDVMVNGRIIVRDRNVLTLKAKEILAKAAEYQKRVRASVGLQEKD